jgi:starch phosphorylase
VFDAQAEVDKAFQERSRWIRMSILSTAGTGKFTSDRTIDEYAKDIWKVEPMPRPLN